MTTGLNRGARDKVRILVIGTAQGSFGAKVAHALRAEMAERLVDGVPTNPDDYSAWEVVEAGLEGADQVYDVTDPLALHDEFMGRVRPHHVVYAVGMNKNDMPGGLASPSPTGASVLANSATDHFELNVAGFLRVAEAFRRVAYPGSHLVAISSNSARIPRSPSLGYCVSKAALSMAVQVLARRWRGEPVVYGYEPGLMNTDATIAAVNAGTYSGRAHRMRGVMSAYGLSADQVAETVAHNLLWGGMPLNGALLRMDAGEL